MLFSFLVACMHPSKPGSGMFRPVIFIVMFDCQQSGSSSDLSITPLLVSCTSMHLAGPSHCRSSRSSLSLGVEPAQCAHVGVGRGLPSRSDMPMEHGRAAARAVSRDLTAMDPGAASWRRVSAVGALERIRSDFAVTLKVPRQARTTDLTHRVHCHLACGATGKWLACFKVVTFSRCSFITQLFLFATMARCSAC